MGAFSTGLVTAAPTSAATGAPAPTRQTAEHGVFGFVANAFQDLKDVVGGIGALGGAAIHDVTHGIQEGVTLGHASGGFIFDDIVKAMPAAIAHDYSSRYGGGIANIAEQAYEHPLSFITDALTIATAGGFAAEKGVAILARGAEVGARAAELGAKTVGEEAAMAARGAITAEETSAAANFVNRVQGFAKQVRDPFTGKVMTIDPVSNPVRRFLYQRPLIKLITERSGEGGPAAEAAAKAENIINTAVDSGVEGLQRVKLAEKTQMLAMDALDNPVPQLRTWAAHYNLNRMTDILVGKTRNATQQTILQLQNRLRLALKDLPDGITPEQLTGNLTGLEVGALSDGYAPVTGLRRTEQFADDPAVGTSTASAASWGGPADSAAAPKPYAVTGAGAVTETWGSPPADSFWYHTSPMDNHQSIVNRGGLDPNLRVTPESAGTHFMPGPRDYTYAPDSPRALYRVGRDKVNVTQRATDDVFTTDWVKSRDMEVYIGNGQWAPVGQAGSMTMEKARSLATSRIGETVPKARDVFGRDAHVTGRVKALDAVSKKADLLGSDWRAVTDVEGYRVVAENALGQDATKLLSRAEQAFDGKVVSRDIAVGTADAGGERGITLTMKANSDGHPFEVQFLNPRAAQTLDATEGFRAAMRDTAAVLKRSGIDPAEAASVIAKGGKAGARRLSSDTIANVTRLLKMQGLSQALWEGVTNDIRASRLGAQLPAEVARTAKMRKVIEDVRLETWRDIIDPAIKNGMDPAEVFDNTYMPLRLAHGAQYDAATGDILSGPSSLALDDMTAKAGLPSPVYFPVVDARRVPTKTQYFMKAQAKQLGQLATDTRARKLMDADAAELLTHDLYLKDPVKAYTMRAGIVARAAEDKALIEGVIDQFGRPLRDWQDRAEGEVIISKGLLRQLFKSKRGTEEAYLDILKAGGKGADNVQGLVDAFKRTVVDNQEQLKNLADPDLVAVPEIVARRLEAHAKVYFGEGVDIAFRAPTQLWKTMVLSGSPRWVVNNIIGNIIFLKNQGGKLSDVVRQLSPKYRAAIKDAIGEPAMARVEGSLTHSLTEQTAKVYSDETLAGSVASTLQRATAKPLSLPRKFAGIIQGLNSDIEDAFRRASYLTAAERQAVRAGIHSTAQSFWTSKAALADVFKVGNDEQLYGKAVSEVDKYLNDYRKMTPLGRNLIRPYIAPFWGFYRHAIKQLLEMPFEHPAKAEVARWFNDAVQSERDKLGPLPNYLQDAIPIIGANPGDLRFMSTRGPNPFNTVLDSPAQMLNPVWKMLYENATGRSMFTGRQFTASDVSQAYGSDQQFKMVPDGHGGYTPMPIDKVTPSFFEQALQQVPQYEMVKDLVSGGSHYDTQGLMDILLHGGQVDPATGRPKYPRTAIDTAARILGYSSYSPDISAYQDGYLKDQQAALSAYLKRIGVVPTQQAGTALTVSGGL